MNTFKDVTETATRRTVNGLEVIIQAMVQEFEATERLIDSLKDRICKLEARELQLSSQTVNVRIDGDIGERLDALEVRIEDFVTEDDVNEQIETAMSDKVTEFDVDSAIEEAIRNLTFTVNVDL
jgi:ClpP class serine protease